MLMGTWAHKQLDSMMRGTPPCDLVPPEDNAKWRALTTGLYAWWEKYGIEHPWEAVLATETPHKVQLSPSVWFQGIPDSWVVAFESLWHVSHKTIDQSKPPSVFCAQQGQTIHEAGYAMLGADIYNIPYGGSMINVVRRLSEKRMNEDAMQALHLEFIPISAKQIARARDDILYTAERMNDEHILRRRVCGGKFLNSKCQYYASCWEGISLDSILYTDYNPTARYDGQHL